MPEEKRCASWEPMDERCTLQVRHLAMAHALRAALPGDPLWADPLAATEGGVDVKEALKRAVTGQLEVRAAGPVPAAMPWKARTEMAVRRTCRSPSLSAIVLIHSVPVTSTDAACTRTSDACARAERMTAYR